MNERVTHRPRPQRTEPRAPEPQASGSSLLDQVRAWGEIAAASLASCRGEDAERELQRRENRGGQ